ncbi:globin domain-containing protein [Curtobacterium sp. Leaf261]|uniref:globin domain-containing protein n=1 Tax=Curtobacterium sp. Leaf261 TaxID=1736311 RepID=UPI0006F35878|nr:globin domain-containing protein [Curtobacterium sp. Leaf261]KQO61521.1 hemin transporter [Curtobacterium sp. Leaf261]
MLSASARAVVEATAPVVAARMPTITPDFYRRLFDAHPELLDGMFNRSTQASGRQSSALAGSVVTFAVALLDGHHPVDLVNRIAGRHASLGVTEPMYAIVYEHLFAAIAADLGDAATDTVVAAWTEVYWLFANLLTARERTLYGQQANSAHWTPWRIAATTPRSSTVREFTFDPADDTPITAASAGQYVGVRVTMPDGVRQVRQYSLLGPGTGRRVAVKLDEGGEVSPVLHALEPGALVDLSNPYGDLTLDDRSTPLVLATAGIGCTPALSFLEQLAARESEREVLVLHAERSRAEWAFSTAIAGLVDRLPNASLETWFDDEPPRSRMDLSSVALPRDADLLLCGPVGFMQAIRHQAVATGIPDERIRYEVFGPDSWLKSS